MKEVKASRDILSALVRKTNAGDKIKVVCPSTKHTSGFCNHMIGYAFEQLMDGIHIEKTVENKIIVIYHIDIGQGKIILTTNDRDEEFNGYKGIRLT